VISLATKIRKTRVRHRIMHSSNGEGAKTSAAKHKMLAMKLLKMPRSTLSGVA
jgi:hypothetical protein